MTPLITFASILVFVSSFKIEPNLNDTVALLETLRVQLELYAKNLPQSTEERANLLVPEIIKKDGYPVEIHKVTSKGYILEMHRIPYGKDGPSANRPVVYIHHGLFAASVDWVIAGPENGFAYILADAGYDVWLANCRGNRYSRKHVTLDPVKDAKRFWDFSWHELGAEDLPEMIDYVIAKTNQAKIFYVGHSQGTTVSYVLCSEKPEYNQKFRAIFSFSPIAYLGNLFSPLIRVAAARGDALTALFNLLGLHELLPHTEWFAKIGSTLCAKDSPFQPVCITAVFAIFGFTPNQMDRTLFPLLAAHYPNGAATKQVSHYGQLINSGKFRQYDYGPLGNLAKYWSTAPPDYKTSKIMAPVYLHYGTEDWLDHTKDVEKLHEELGNSQGKFITSEPFNHIDFLFAVDVRKVLYDKVLTQMKQH